MREPQKPAYRRKQEHAAKERQEAEQHNDNVKIIAALNRVADEQNAANNEESPKQKSKRCREIATIVGIYVAAGVALLAILITHWDSSDQIGALRSQLDAMRLDQRAWVGVAEINVLVGPGLAEPPEFKLAYVLKDVGRLPAFVEVVAKIIVSHDSDWPQKQKRMCDEEVAQIKIRGWVHQTGGNTTFAILPNDPWPYHLSSKLEGDLRMDESYQPWIVGCVIYKSGFSETFHKTPFFGIISLDYIEHRMPRDEVVPIRRHTKIPEGTILVVKAISLVGETD